MWSERFRTRSKWGTSARTLPTGSARTSSMSRTGFATIAARMRSPLSAVAAPAVISG